MISIRSNSRIKSRKIGTHLERISKIKTFMNRYNRKETNYSSRKGDWKKYEKTNPAIALNELYVKNNNIYPTCI